MATTTYTLTPAWCNFHPDCVAEFDFKTTQRPWAYGCEEAWWAHRQYPDLGTGKGQQLVQGPL